jgi:hypothetical protein
MREDQAINTLGFFKLPLFGETVFSVHSAPNIEDLATGIFMVIDMCDDMAANIARNTEEGEMLAHSMRILLRVALAATSAIGYKNNPQFGWVSRKPSEARL